MDVNSCIALGNILVMKNGLDASWTEHHMIDFTFFGTSKIWKQLQLCTIKAVTQYRV